MKKPEGELFRSPPGLESLSPYRRVPIARPLIPAGSARPLPEACHYPKPPRARAQQICASTDTFPRRQRLEVLHAQALEMRDRIVALLVIPIAHRLEQRAHPVVQALGFGLEIVVADLDRLG